MRVVIADDHKIVRDGLRWMLSEEHDIDIVGEATDGSELLDVVVTTDAEVVLLDVSMPGVGGFDALEQLRASMPQIRVLMLTVQDDPSYVRRAIELGADGYLLKSTGRVELTKALRTVASGGAFLHGEMVGPLVRAITDEGLEATTLSPRGLQVLELVAQGLENKQIALSLGISIGTVKAHLQEAFDRLGVQNRAEAVAVAMRAGILS